MNKMFSSDLKLISMKLKFLQNYCRIGYWYTVLALRIYKFDNISYSHDAIWSCLFMVPFQVLFEQFKFFLNLYFLVMALSQFIPEIRIGYLYTYWGPLVSTFWYPVSNDQFYFQFYMTSLWYMLHKVNPQPISVRWLLLQTE